MHSNPSSKLLLLVPLLLGVAAASQTIDDELARSVVDSVRPDVERLRGLAFKRPVPVRVINDDQARRYVLQRLEKFGVREQLVLTGEAYGLLGLLPEKTDVLEAFLAAIREQAGGFYDPDQQVFVLLNDAPASLVRVLTAHELTHALEDQHFSLDKRLEAALGDDDLAFAVGSVHEGSAILVMTKYMSERMLDGSIDRGAMTAMAETESGRAEMLERLPPVLLRQLLGPYLLGARFLTRGNLMASMTSGIPTDDLNHVYKDGPLSSEQILHPEKYWSPAQRDEPQPVSFDGVGARLGRGWKKRGEGVLGELTLGVLTGAGASSGTRAMLVADIGAWTNEASSGWGGDRWELWAKGKAKVVLCLTQWDTPEDAAQFAAALPRQTTFERSGRRVAIVAGKLGDKAAELLEALIGAGQPVETPNQNG